MTVQSLNPESLAERMFAELNEDPASRRLLLRTLLTDEFLMLPAKEDGLMDLPDRGGRVGEGAADFEAGQDIVLWQLDRLVDYAYESRMMENVDHIVRWALDMRRSKVLKGNFADADEMCDKVEDAETRGIITHEQGDRLFLADAVVSGMVRSDGSLLHAVVEISAAIGESNVLRAAERAAILSAVTGEPAKGVVVGNRISEPERRHAKRVDVAVALIRDKWV